MVKVMKIMVFDLLQKVTCRHCTLSAPDTAAGHRQPCLHQRLLDTQCSNSWVSLLCWVFFFAWVTQGCLCPPKFCFPNPYGVVNGDLLQESFCHTQSLMSYTSIGDTLATVLSSLCGMSGSLAHTMFWFSKHF